LETPILSVFALGKALCGRFGEIFFQEQSFRFIAFYAGRAAPVRKK
jgi:hypothetical protein